MFLPPTITFEFAAEEKNVRPAAVTSLTAAEIGPSWKNGSAKRVTSSTITCVPAPLSARIWFANASSLPPLLENAIAAPGAMSWTIWIIARPSSMFDAGSVPSART